MTNVALLSASLAFGLGIAAVWIVSEKLRKHFNEHLIFGSQNLLCKWMVFVILRLTLVSLLFMYILLEFQFYCLLSTVVLVKWREMIFLAPPMSVESNWSRTEVMNDSLHALTFLSPWTEWWHSAAIVI